MKERCQSLMVASLQNFVLEYGEEMSDYFRNEYGMDEEGDDNVTITKVVDLASHGCYFSLPLIHETDGGEDDYEHYAFWSLYTVVDNETNEIDLKYYCFYNAGFSFNHEGSEPDHNYVRNLSLAQLEYIYSAILSMKF